MTAGCSLHRTPAHGTAVRTPAPQAPRPRSARHDYPAEPPTAGKARRHTRQFLTTCPGISADLADTAELLVSELIANACTASPDGTTVTLALRLYRNRLLITVTDESPEPPVPAGPGTADNDDIGGRGLVLVAALAAGWGYYPLGDGRKNVWATLAVPARLPRPPQRAGAAQAPKLPGAREGGGARALPPPGTDARSSRHRGPHVPANGTGGDLRDRVS